MTTALDGHIHVDDRQVARIGGSRIKVMHLVMEAMANGYTPQQLHEQHPHLKLAQIYAALTYYHDHKEQFDRQIEESTQRVDRLRAEAGESPFPQTTSRGWEDQVSIFGTAFVHTLFLSLAPRGAGSAACREENGPIG
jgi:uncharacterized protein (DUF433 family)